VRAFEAVGAADVTSEADDHHSAEEYGSGDGHRKRRRRRRTALVAGAAVVASAAVLGTLQWQSDDGTRPAGSDVPDAATTEVTRTDLSDSRTLSGSLGYGQVIPVRAYGEATVTWLPRTGTSVRRGEPLYRMDDRPVPLFYGSTPFFRTLRLPGTVGRDVKSLADNLRALGYDIGPQPAVGTWVAPQAAPEARDRDTENGDGRGDDGGEGARVDRTGSGGPTAGTEGAAGTGASAGAGESADGAGTGTAAPAQVKVREGDAVLTDSLIAAVKRWQSAIGAPVTGVIGPEDAVVLSGAVRVAGVPARLGDRGAGQLLSVTSTGKRVTVQVPADEVGTIRRGDRVTVTLPDSGTVPGEVTGLSSTVQGEDDPTGGESAPKVMVTVSVADEDAVRGLDSAPVRVEFTSSTRRDVLAVPAGALLALAGGGYALQRPGGQLVPVKTGMYARGQVEVSGPGVTEGLRVVTTS
jgi:hypothetical protein